MITFSNKHSFEFIASSGALAFDGRGWPWEWPFRWSGLLDPTAFTIVVKTLTRKPRAGNLRWTHPWSVIKKLPRWGFGGESGFSPEFKSKHLASPVRDEGWINAIGLTNSGIDWWLKDVEPNIPENYKIIVSLEADDLEETLEMIEMVQKTRVLGIELNLSCPNTSTADARTTEKTIRICEAANKASDFPLIAKLSCTHDYLTIAKELKACKAFQAISINSVPWKIMFPEKKSPLARYGGGGVSGKIIQPISWKMVKELSQATKIPVIAPSIWHYEDIQKVFDLGAKAASFGSIFISYPWKPTAYVKRWIRS